MTVVVVVSVCTVLEKMKQNFMKMKLKIKPFLQIFGIFWIILVKNCPKNAKTVKRFWRYHLWISHSSHLAQTTTKTYVCFLYLKLHFLGSYFVQCGICVLVVSLPENENTESVAEWVKWCQHVRKQWKWRLELDKSEAKEEAAVAEATKNLLYWVCTQDLRYYLYIWRQRKNSYTSKCFFKTCIIL